MKLTINKNGVIVGCIIRNTKEESEVRLSGENKVLPKEILETLLILQINRF